jgi:hypothetical protein
VGDKTLWILIAVAAVYFLFVRKAAPTGYRPPAPAAYRPPQPQPQSAGQQAIQAGASALGSFLGQLASGRQSGSSSNSDDLISPSWGGTSGAAFADDSLDSLDSDSYAFS